MARATFSGASLTSPAWAADGLGPIALVPGGARLDPTAFPYEEAVKVTLTANASANTTSISVTALSGAIPSGSTLYFGGAKYATLTAAAAAGATSLTVSALVTALVSGDIANYSGSVARKPVAAGTLIGRTFAERAAGTGFSSADVATDEEFYLLAFDVVDALFEASCDLYRHQCLVKENFLPNWANLTTDEKAKIRSLYQCIVGVA